MCTTMICKKSMTHFIKNTIHLKIRTEKKLEYKRKFNFGTIICEKS